MRPCLIFGYGDNNQRYLGHIINSIKKNKKIAIYPGNQFRDYMHVDDLVKVLTKIIKNYKKKYNLILNISAKNHVKLKTIPMMIEKIIKKKINFKIKERKKKQINLCNSNSKLLKLFPDLKFLSFKRGLIKTLKDESIL